MVSVSGIVMKPPAAACTSNQFQLELVAVLVVLPCWLCSSQRKGPGAPDGRDLLSKAISAKRHEEFVHLVIGHLVAALATHITLDAHKQPVHIIMLGSISFSSSRGEFLEFHENTRRRRAPCRF